MSEETRRPWTPGPWKYIDHGFGMGIYSTHGGREYPFAEFVAGGEPSEGMIEDGDAQLIALAPEMAEFILGMDDDWAVCSGTDAAGIVRRLRAIGENDE